MPVFRYRGVEEMPQWELTPLQDRARLIREVWIRAATLARLDPPRGVQKFRSIEEAQAARDEATRLRMASHRR